VVGVCEFCVGYKNQKIIGSPSCDGEFLYFNRNLYYKEQDLGAIRIVRHFCICTILYDSLHYFL
jgi:hypothetical protein